MHLVLKMNMAATSGYNYFTKAKRTGEKIPVLFAFQYLTY